eukprot:3635266-Alexandrium_andersonii.AAC.1
MCIRDRHLPGAQSGLALSGPAWRPMLLPTSQPQPRTLAQRQRLPLRQTLDVLTLCPRQVPSPDPAPLPIL